MEQKLFLIGLATGAYWYALRETINHPRLKKPKAAAAFHAVFGGLAAFIIMLLLAVSMESRGTSGAPYSTPAGQAALWIAAVAGALGWNFFSALKKPEAARAASLKGDLEWAETISSAMLLASVVMFFLFQAFRIPSGSMRVTLLEGDHLFINKIVYGIRAPFVKKRVAEFKKIQRGDVIVFRFPSESADDMQCGGSQYGRDFIKRVIGLPGDVIALKDGKVSVNGSPLSGETYAQYTDNARLAGPKLKDAAEYQKRWAERDLGRTFGEGIRDNFGPVTVPQGAYFAMGDNRDHSCDSRFWGPVPEENIKGRAWFIYWPPSRINSVK
ncbi:MAG: signal peptidase I [Elusimicrobiales bacterium]|nr:signal peptidase I [Elusimicrobiales bacterium]